MKLGLLARADNTGLGIQTFEFYRHMKPDKTMVVDISSLNANRQFFDRYPGAQISRGFPNLGAINEFLEGLDAVFVAESPYNYALYQRARELGIKVAVQYNYEFFDWFSFPYYPTPDLLIAPSRWHYEKVQKFAEERGIPHVYLHCPVNRKALPFTKRSQAKHFIHVQGNAAIHDRNGTEIVRHVNKLLPPYVQVEILTQANGAGPADYWQLYEKGDVMVLPRRYGGNCLPVNEALSLGMPVIMPDISPNNQLLPREWLVRADKAGEFKPRTVVDLYDADPLTLAEKIIEFYNMTPEEMEGQSLLADAVAKSISWDVLGPLYTQTLRQLCQK